MTDHVVFSSDPVLDLSQFFQQKRYSKFAVLVDENTSRHCYPILKKALPQHECITVKSGEEHKNLETCADIWREMTHQNLDRHSLLIILGGGVLGDMGGFCAATYKRGIDFVLIPTTLLSQVDSSIGGKLGIDFEHLKNHIGVFQLPVLTLLHAGFLKTLPGAELRSGFAEIIKHTLISDAAMWKKLSQHGLQSQHWEELIRHSVEFKKRVVTEDPKEKGLRKILNAGHTIGHALETHLLNTNRKVMHGEAVAAGLVMEAYLAEQRKMLTGKQLEEIYRYIVGIFGKITTTDTDDVAIARLTLQDKKNSGNKILCVLQEGIGKAKWDCEISAEEVKQALTFYRAL